MRDTIVRYKGDLGRIYPATGEGRKGEYVFKPYNKKRYNSATDDLVDQSLIEQVSDEDAILYLVKTFSWGIVLTTHVIGDYQIIEYINDDKERGFHIYVNFSDTNWSTDTLDKALVAAISYKYDGCNTQAHCFISRMLSL